MKCSELFRLLKKEGWYAVSQKGSHVKMKHDTQEMEQLFFRIMEVRKLEKDLRRKF